MSLAEIAVAAGLDNSTVHRLLQALVDTGYVVKQPWSKRYCGGPKGLSPLSLYHPLNDLRREIAPVLHSLRDEIRETTALVLFIGYERLAVDFAKSKDPFNPYYDTWIRSPIHCSASGKALLGRLSRAERRKLLGEGPYEAHTPRTIADPAELDDDLETAQVRGFVIARDSTIMGLTSIAAPIKLGGNNVGCLVVAGGSMQFDDKHTQEIGFALMEAANLVSHGMPSLKVLIQRFGLRISESESRT